MKKLISSLITKISQYAFSFSQQISTDQCNTIYLYTQNIPYIKEQSINEEGWKIAYFIEIHNSNDKQYSSDKKELVLELVLNFDGTFTKNIINKDIVVKRELSKGCHSLLEYSVSEFVAFILENKRDNIVWFENNLLDSTKPNKIMLVIQFFLKYKGLKDLNFYHWSNKTIPLEEYNDLTYEEAISAVLSGKKHKVIKKAFYNNFQQQIHSNSRYNPAYDYIFTYYFTDTNYATPLVALPQTYKEILFEDSTFDEISSFISFLFSHYTENQLFKLIMGVVNNQSQMVYFQDTFKMFLKSNYWISQDFQKCKANIKIIHDIFLNFIEYDESKPKIIFTYRFIETQKEGNFNGLTFRLPNDSKELFTWGKLLKNCLYTYTSSIFSHSSLVYGVFKDNFLLYAVEMSEGNIIQMSGIQNSSIPIPYKRAIESWSMTKEYND